MSETESAAWDVYSATKEQRRRTNSRGETTWFNWTQYADHGPGAEVLSLKPGESALDLGCGSGGNLAHLAALGMKPVGVDLSSQQLRKARDRWGDAPGMELHQGGALDFMTVAGTTFDAVYSVFGAAWFCDPGLLLPAVHASLRPGGVFALSQRPPVQGCYGCQASYIPRGPDEDPAIVKRWDYEPGVWAALLGEYGFTAVTTAVLPAPVRDKRTIGTLLIRAVRDNAGA
ncbi:class I SAM-dependent methyltransferase [Streptomyces yaizuensis]|uniref:Class I SAM-dependent methyltransferase n=1 Tax=Streptomyces yaizuensis TaxID=2989713 RepID=A0ABQ5P9K8_9ACTN|nr:class I SAM-dependent methyltransferase [Streptomyces sp. YSPA8]GLF99255.1 class I SAM-dependent methyltransferase [Streptomyces sp. YSPA8]